MWLWGSFTALLVFGGVTFAAEPLDTGPLRDKANIFIPLSTPAEAILEASLLVSWICFGIFVVVGGLTAYAIWKFRKPRDDDQTEPPQVYGSLQIELAWTVIPILITVVLILVTARTVGEIQNAEMPDDALRIRLVGHQWWWEIHYPGLGIVTANEIHVPVSSPEARRITHFTLQSADVIHSFWVPQLAGKTDCVPNRDNQTWIEPHKTGTYLGNCAEYCGTQHAGMRLRVVVHTPASFDAWVKNQQRPPVEDPAFAAGKLVFETTSCVNCHAIAGTNADGVFGPDLSHFASRQTLAAGQRSLTRDNLKAWLADPQAVKPGALMPDMQLTPKQVDNLADYLLSLK